MSKVFMILNCITKFIEKFGLSSHVCKVMFELNRYNYEQGKQYILFHQQVETHNRLVQYLRDSAKMKLVPLKYNWFSLTLIVVQHDRYVRLDMKQIEYLMIKYAIKMSSHYRR